MKKITFAASCAFAFLLISSLATVIFRRIFAAAPKKSAWGFVAVGLALILAFGVVYLKLHDRVAHRTALDAACFLFNSLCLGVSMTGWYVDRGFANPLWLMALVSLAAVASMFALYAVVQIPFIKKAKTFWIVFLLALSLVGYVLLVVFTKTTYVSTYGYYSIVMIAFFFALCVPAEDEKKLFSNMIVATFSVVAVAVLMLLILLGADGLDLDLPSFGDGRKKDGNGR